MFDVFRFVNLLTILILEIVGLVLCVIGITSLKVDVCILAAILYILSVLLDIKDDLKSDRNSNNKFKLK